MVAIILCYRRTSARSSRDGFARDALAGPSQETARSMKIIAAFFLALALILRAAPSCASPFLAESSAITSVCADALKSHDEQTDDTNDDARLTCHACVFPPVVDAMLVQPSLAHAVVEPSTITRLMGGFIAPPTPPPRAAWHCNFQLWNGVIS